MDYVTLSLRAFFIILVLKSANSLPLENFRVEETDSVNDRDGHPGTINYGSDITNNDNTNNGNSNDGMTNLGNNGGFETVYLQPEEISITEEKEEKENDPFVSDNRFYDLIETDTQQQASGDSIFAGDVIPTIEQLQTYLQTFGYLPTDQENITPSEFEYGFVKLQHFVHIPVTGKFDYFTSRQMAYPRCGLPDLDSETPNDDNDDRQLPLFAANRLAQTTTYNVLSYPDGIDKIQVEIAIAEAMTMWQGASCTTFQRISEAELSDISFSWERQNPAIFGEPKQIAYSVKTRESAEPNRVPRIIYFDRNNEWTVETNTSLGLSIPRIVAHSIGHVLGLPHSDIRSSIMWPYYDDNVPQEFQLDQSDIDSLRSIYGIPCARQFQPPAVTPLAPNVPNRPQTNIPTNFAGRTNRQTGITNAPNRPATNVPSTMVPRPRTNVPTTLRPPSVPPRRTPTPPAVTQRPPTPPRIPPYSPPPRITPAPPVLTNPPPTLPSIPPSPPRRITPTPPRFTNRPPATRPPATQPRATQPPPTRPPTNQPTTIISTIKPNVGQTTPQTFRITCPFYPFYTFELQFIPYPSYPNELCQAYAQYNRPVGYFQRPFYPPFQFRPPFFGRPFRKK